MHRICHISTVHSSFDIRIFHKECKTLAENGYDVSLIITHDKETTAEGVHIIPLEKEKNRMERVMKKKKDAFQKALDTNAEIYHIHDPELLGMGIKLKKLGKKVIYDSHEDASAAVLTREWIPSFMRRMVSAALDSYEKRAVKYFDAVVAARPDIAAKFPVNKTALVRNMPVLKMIDKVVPIDITPDKPVVIYAGGITRIRGIKEIIKAVGRLNGRVEFWLLGGFDDLKYKEECEKEPGYKYTKYFGLVSPEKAYSYMKKATIGITNFLPAPNHVFTQPNKPFEYMTCSLPMVMSDFAYWQKMFSDCALFANPKKPEEIAAQIAFLLDNPEISERMRRKGRRYIEENYSWESEQTILLELYESLLADKRKTR